MSWTIWKHVRNTGSIKQQAHVNTIEAYEVQRQAHHKKCKVSINLTPSRLDFVWGVAKETIEQEIAALLAILSWKTREEAIPRHQSLVVDVLVMVIWVISAENAKLFLALTLKNPTWTLSMMQRKRPSGKRLPNSTILGNWARGYYRALQNHSWMYLPSQPRLTELRPIYSLQPTTQEVLH